MLKTGPTALRIYLAYGARHLIARSSKRVLICSALLSRVWLLPLQRSLRKAANDRYLSQNDRSQLPNCPVVDLNATKAVDSSKDLSSRHPRLVSFQEFR